MNASSLILLFLLESRGPAFISLYFSCHCTQWRCIHIYVTHFCVHRGGDKGAGGTPAGEGEGKVFTSGFWFLSLMKSGAAVGIRVLDRVVLPLALSIRDFFFPPLGGLCPALLWVSSGVLGLAHIDDGWDVLLHRHPRHGPQLLCTADLLLVAVSLSRGKKNP